MYRLDCHVKNYAWGKDGEDSEVARLFAAGHPKHVIGSQTPYAELWMGTHPDGPARIRESSENLSRLIARSSYGHFDTSDAFMVATNNRGQREEIHLPFIMKIMSIKHTLSLQVHPTKAQAKYLHMKDPLNYPDRHHKPELAYALTRFELLCGFRPAKEIVQNLKAFPELRVVMGLEATAEFERLVEAGVPQESEKLKNALRECFTTMLYAQLDAPKLVNLQLEKFYDRLQEGVRGALIEDTIPVLESMRSHFPNDVGCFSPLYLNHMILQPGECCFYAAEELHAYLSGECVECVGCSNNTIRAALTPKYIDRPALIEVLNYRMTTPDFYLVPRQPVKDHPSVVEYAPDCKDFTLHEISWNPPSCSEPSSPPASAITLPALDCASIMVVVEGEGNCDVSPPLSPSSGGSLIRRGDIFYIPPHTSATISEIAHRFLAYRTFSYEVGPDHSNRMTTPLPNHVKLPTAKASEPSFYLNKKPTSAIRRPKFDIESDESVFNLDADMDGLC